MQTRHVKKPRLSNPPSALEPLSQPVAYRGVTIQRQRLGVIARELPALFKKHHAELAVDRDRAPLDPDWDRYFDLDRLGILQIVTVRDGPALVGYIFNIIGPNLHKRSTRFGVVDMYWLHPAYRFGLLGLKLFRENERFLKSAGVQKIAVAEKAHFANSGGRKVNVLFKRLGYVAEDVVHGKWIGD